MLFHAFRVVYAVKELDSHAKHGQSFKKRFGSMTEHFCAKDLPSGFVQVSESFFNHGSSWRNEGWNSLYGHFSQKSAPEHASTSARARVRPSTRFILQYRTRSGRMPLKKSVFDGKGAFTPDTNEALRANDLHVKSMQRRDRKSCGAIRVNEAARMAWITRRELSVWRASWKIRTLANICTALTNQKLALAVTN